VEAAVVEARRRVRLNEGRKRYGGRDEDRDTRQRIIANRLDISKKIGID
jgi:hypothetical protein